MRKLRVPVDEAFISLGGLFDSIYADIGKASVAPERLISTDPGRKEKSHEH